MPTIRRMLPVVLLLWGATHPSFARAYDREMGAVVDVSFGVGTGDGEGIAGDRTTGLGSGIRLGYVVAPGFDAGIEDANWIKGAFTHDVWMLDVLAASVRWHPREGRAYIKTGIGRASIRHTLDVGNSTVKDSEHGLGVILAAGYEWRVGRKVVVGPEVDFGYSKIRDGLSMNFTNLNATAKWYF